MAQLAALLGRHAPESRRLVAPEFAQPLDAIRPGAIDFATIAEAPAESAVAGLGACRHRRQEGGQSDDEKRTETSFHGRYRRPNS